MDWSPEQENTRVEAVTVFGVPVRAGDRVRLWPQRSADIMDMALKGKVAVVEAIECDYDDHVHLAVVLEEDPGRDFGMLRQPGHRFFFSPEEIEPVTNSGELPK
jgi:ABC-type Fe3+ transport system substrate-binding protein